MSNQKKKEFIKIKMNREIRDVVLKFLKVMQAEAWNTTQPLIANEKFGDAANEIIDFFSHLDIEHIDDCSLEVQHYYEILGLFNLSNAQRDSETFLIPKEDDIFYDFMDDCATQINILNNVK